MSQPRELIAEASFDHDGWPFTIRTVKTPQGFIVQSFLRAIPVSGLYLVSPAEYESRSGSGEDLLGKLVEVARDDLRKGKYREHILRWAAGGHAA